MGVGPHEAVKAYKKKAEYTPYFFEKFPVFPW